MVWGAALNSSDQSMLSVMSTALSRLGNIFDTRNGAITVSGIAVDAEKFCNEKSAIFIVLPEEDTSKYFHGKSADSAVIPKDSGHSRCEMRLEHFRTV